MSPTKRGGCRFNDATASSSYIKHSEKDGYLITLHPKGSENNIKIETVKRELNRPDIFFGKVVIQISIVLLVSILLNLFYYPAGFVASVLYTIIMRKRIIIWCVRVYQRYAPAHIRRACVFNPSCSEYMVHSVQKHGMFRGVYKGILRLRRCHAPNCGDDFP